MGIGLYNVPDMANVLHWGLMWNTPWEQTIKEWWGRFKEISKVEEIHKHQMSQDVVWLYVTKYRNFNNK